MNMLAVSAALFVVPCTLAGVIFRREWAVNVVGMLTFFAALAHAGYEQGDLAVLEFDFIGGFVGYVLGSLIVVVGERVK